MDPTVLNNQGLSFKIKDWTLDAYRRVLENEMIWRGFLNSFLYSLAFTVISVFVTLLAAYPLSKKEFEMCIRDSSHRRRSKTDALCTGSNCSSSCDQCDGYKKKK